MMRLAFFFSCAVVVPVLACARAGAPGASAPDASASDAAASGIHAPGAPAAALAATRPFDGPPPMARCQSAQPRKKQPGDLSYETMWRMQQRVSAMLPRRGELITPVLRLSVNGAGERERNEFLPPSCGIAIMGKTVDTVLPVRRGGYFEVPSIAQAQVRNEEAIVRFHVEPKKKSFEVAWQVAVPGSGVMPYGQLSRAFDELKVAQHQMAWWDIMLIDEKRARFDAVRACFAHAGGAILVDGAAAGTPLSRHCALLPFDAAHAQANAPVTFVGALESVTLDNTAHYGNEARRN